MDNKSSIYDDLLLCIVDRSVHSFKGQFCLFIVNMFVRTEWRQDREGADERVIIVTKKNLCWMDRRINKGHKISGAHPEFGGGADKSFLFPTLKADDCLGNNLPRRDRNRFPI